MTIDKVGGTNYIQPNKNAKQIDKAYNAGVDRVEISTESKITSQNEYLLNVIRQTPDIREDKVIEGKEKLSLYMNDENAKNNALNSLAESLTDSLFSVEDSE